MKNNPESLEARYLSKSRRENPNIEMPSDSIPAPPDEEHRPVEMPPRTPDNQPDPPPIEEPNQDEPKRLF
jgi:hypothetical protein